VSPWRRIRGGVSILIVVLAVGTTGYILIEGVSLFDALYMVATTITTVGFKEVFELSTAGQLWTLGLIGVGIGVALYTAAALIEYLIDLREARKRIRMKRLVAKHSDHVIVCGFGRVGRGTWAAPIEHGNQVVVIEADLVRAEAAQDEGAAVILGDATHNDTLKEAGVFKARASNRMCRR
jgi:voltage-gated potassium channel